MNNLFQNSSGQKSEHPRRELLLLFVDGELPPKEAAQMDAHLEACWPCRVKTQRIQGVIADIIEFDEQVLAKSFVPPEDWRNFDRQLNQLVGVSGKQSLSSRLIGSLGRFLLSGHLFAFPRQLLRPMVRIAIALALLALMVTVVIRLRKEPIVSASQLLTSSIAAQAQQIRATANPVVHQRVRLRRTDPARDNTISWEIWNDTTNGRVRQFINGQSIPVDIKLNTTSSPASVLSGDLVDELTKVFRDNHMDATRPLSATSYQSWHNTLTDQRDEVTKSILPNGSDGLVLRTIVAAPVRTGQIAEATFVVRASDWLPTELRLRVAAEGGTRSYELSETISEIIDLARVDPAVFANHVLVSASPAGSPHEETAQKDTPALAANPQPLVATAKATAELEVEALRLLNQARADLGEQISLKRTSDELLEINGIVETDQRKSEIISILAPLVANPAVRIQIQTVVEAVASQRTTKPTPSPSARAVEITSNSLAAEADLRAYFAGKLDTDEAIRQYAARMVSLSGRAMAHLWAMKRLLRQFSPEQIRAMSPEGRVKWMSLIRSHARLYEQASEAERRELRPVFFATQPQTEPVDNIAITDTNELIRAVDQLFDLGSSNDRVIRSAFTASSDGVVTTVIKTPQFWQSLGNAQRLSAKIANVP